MRNQRSSLWLFPIALALLAQSAAQEPTIAGQWTGVMNAMGSELRVVVKFRPEADGGFRGSMLSPDESPDEISFSSVVQEALAVTAVMESLNARFTGELNAAGNVIEGEWTQMTMTIPLRLELESREVQEAVVVKREPAPPVVKEWLKEGAVPLKTVAPGNGFRDMQPLKAIVGDSRIVALGEATHGTREFFQLKHRMLELLVEEMGFRIFAIEANWTEALLVNDYVLRGEGDAAKALAGMYFWVWNTEEVLAMIEWLRAYNLDPAHAEKVQFLGFDMQFSHVALREALLYLDKVDPTYASETREQLQPLMRRQLMAGFGKLPLAERGAIISRVVRLIERFDRRGAEYIEKSSQEQWRAARQNAVIVRQAAGMFESEPPSFEARDRAMADNVAWILEQNPKDKIVLWAHNGHVGKTNYGPYRTMGMFLGERYGPQMVVFGFSFNQGGFRAVKQGSGPIEFVVGPAMVGGLDETLASVGAPILAVDLRPVEGTVREWLDAKQRTRSIGAVYSEELEASYQQPISPRKTFDAVLFVENTTPSRRVRSTSPAK